MDLRRRVHLAGVLVAAAAVVTEAFLPAGSYGISAHRAVSRYTYGLER